MDLKAVDNDRFYARYSYESLIIQQSHLSFSGLWTNGQSYYAICPNLSDSLQTFDGKNLIEWFNQHCKMASCPIVIVKQPPENSTQIPERTIQELAMLHGEPLTRRDVHKELIAALPKTFPYFEIDYRNNKLILESSVELTEDEKQLATLCCLNLKYDVEYATLSSKQLEEVNSSTKLKKLRDLDALYLEPSTFYKPTFTPEVYQAYEADEEFWIDQRLEILTGDLNSTKKILPSEFQQSNSTCFIDATVFPPTNIRAYLTVYQKIILALPLESHFESALKGLNTTKKELLELVQLGRVCFVLPQPLDRYDTSFIQEILEINKNAVILSRQLAAATIIKTRQHFPILYPTLGTSDRKALLNLLGATPENDFANVLRQELGNSWIGMELHLTNEGAMATSRYGIGRFLGQLLYQKYNHDARLELTTCCQSMDWARALNASYAPIEFKGYSDFKAAQLITRAYSGVLDNKKMMTPACGLSQVIPSLLTLNNDASVTEINQVFNEADRSRLNSLLYSGILDGNINEFINEINTKIKKFENDQKRLDKIDVYGFGAALVTYAMKIDPTISPAVGFSSWLLKYVLKSAESNSELGSTLLDWIRGLNSFTSASPVLVSRLRSKAKQAL